MLARGSPHWQTEHACAEGTDRPTAHIAAATVRARIVNESLFDVLIFNTPDHAHGVDQNDAVLERLHVGGGGDGGERARSFHSGADVIRNENAVVGNVQRLRDRAAIRAGGRVIGRTACCDNKANITAATLARPIFLGNIEASEN